MVKKCSSLMYLLLALFLTLAIPAGNSAAVTNLVTNGTFEGGFYTHNGDDIPNDWNRGSESSTEEGSYISQFTDNGPSAAGSYSVGFSRLEGESDLDWTTVAYNGINGIDASGYSELALNVDVKVTFQDIPAGDYGWVFPAYARLYYLDPAGAPKSVTYGWGYSLIGSPPNNCTLVTQNVWHTESLDLLAMAPDIHTLDKLWLGGAGNSYSSRMDNVQLMASSVPEPCTLVLTGMGLLSAAGFLRKKR